MKEQKILPIIKNTKIWLTFSLILIVISLGSWMIRGLNFGIDFVGGTIVTINVHTTFDVKDVRTITDKYDKNADITYAGDSKQEVVISTKESLYTTQRAELFSAFKTKYNLKDSEILMMGDDIPDIGIMKLAEISACPANAVQEVKAIADYISPVFGGKGAVRDVIEQVMKVQGKWNLDEETKSA